MNLDASMSFLNIDFVLPVELIQIFNFSLKVLFPLNLLLLEMFLVLSILFLIENSLFFICLPSKHDFLDCLLGFSVHLLVLKFLIILDDFTDDFDVWLREVMVAFNALCCP